MKRLNVRQLTSAELVERFAEICVAQDEAELGGQIAKYNGLYKKMTDVTNELKSRDGDQRIELLKLYDHPNLHVRVQVAKLTLAVAPKPARSQIEMIAASGRLPYSADAGMCIWNLDRGVFKPT